MSHSDYSNSLTTNCLRLFGAVCLAVFWPSAPAFSQCSLTCNDGLQISLDATGQVAITTQLIAPNAAATCPGTLQLRLFSQQGFLLPTNILDCSHIGQTITAEVKHLASGNSCSGTLQVNDFLPPTVVCTDKFVFCHENISPDAVGLPTMTDNCTPPNLLTYTYSDETTDLGCGIFQNGHQVLKRIDRTWFVTDGYGNSTSCVQKIWLKHIALANVVFPPSMDGIAAPALNCDQDPTDISLTGQPTVEGIPIDNSPDCEFGVAYSDQIINICPPAGYSVLRTWTAVDFCSGTVSSRLQIIKVEDKTPPMLTLPGDFTVGTDGFLCTGTVEFPPADVSDDCSAVAVVPTWVYGTGFGPFVGVSLGTHLVTYTATDACGNSTQKTVNVTVVDIGPPQAICTSDLQVSLSAGGVGAVNAGTIDQGSFDNCGPVTLSISRNDTLFESSVLVTCADIGTPLPVTLRVTDAVGLENFCVTEVSVRDFLKPNIQCPADVTLTCLQDFNDLQLTGEASATDNCAMQSLDFVNIGNVGFCNVGALIRMWTATDAAGNTKTCFQNILLEAVSTVAVTFPPDFTVTVCDGVSSTLPPATGEPATSGLHCSPLSVTYTDQIFDSGLPPACYRIFRTWKVIDFCIYDINDDSTGIWEHTQIIDVVDDTPPLLLLPPDVTVAADLPGCLAQVALADVVATDCSDQIVISNDGIYADAPGANASGNYPVGHHLVVFTATDGCGNVAQQTLLVTVQDLVAPTAICKNGVVANLDTAGVVTLDGAQLDGGSSDNCSPSANLSFSVFPQNFYCQTIGTQPVVLTVVDETGNSSTCTTTVNVADPTNACLPPPPGDFIIEGMIRTETGVAVAEIPLTLQADGFSATSDCDADGQYIFEDVPGDNLYTLRPHNDAKWLNGITTFDLVVITKHILGLAPFDSPYKYIAADANRSGTVTTFDIVQFRKLILGLADTVPGNTSWRFVEAAWSFSDPAAPLDTFFPEQIVLSDLTANQSGQDFVGVKIGDLNNSVNAADPRSPRDTLLLYAQNLELPAGETTALPFYLKNWAQLEGFQFELALDSNRALLQKIEFARPELFGEANVFFRPDGKLAVSWNNAATENMLTGDSLVFTLHLLGKQKTNTRHILALTGERIQPEAYSEDESPAAIGLHLGNPPGFAHPSFIQSSARPNPFAYETAISFQLSEAAELTLRVSDVSGKIVLTKKASFPAGWNEWRIGRAELPGTGMYGYRMLSSTFAGAGGKVILLSE